MRGLESWKKTHRVLLPKEIQKEDLNLWNHIYTWCRDNTNRHGIYDGDGKVIQLNITRPAGFMTHEICSTCGNHDQLRPAQGEGLVVSTSLDDFLSGGNIYLFEYGVDLAHFGFTKLWEDTCTLASSDPPQVVEERASFLLNDGSSADHYRYIDNGKDFAIYCKTGLVLIDRIDFRRSRQTAFFLAITAVAFFDYEQKLMLAATFWGLFGRYVGIYCICRFAFDIGAHTNVIKVDQAGSLPQVEIFSGTDWDKCTLESLVDTFLLISILAFALCLLSTKWSEPLQAWSDTLRVVWSLPYITFFYWAVLQRRLLSNKIQKGQLKRGDHIYTYRRGHSYSHHGIYVGNGKVIHLIRGEASISGGGQPTQNHVESCCINCFLAGGELCLYKYGVNIAFFMAKTRGGTCTHVFAAPTEDVVQRAEHLLGLRGFGAYNLFNNNCEDFAVYCKTGLFSTIDFVSHGTNGQIASFVAIFIAFVFLKSLIIPTSNFIDVAAAVYFIYSVMRYTADWGTEVTPQNLVAAIQSRTRNSRFWMRCFFKFSVFLVIIVYSVGVGMDWVGSVLD
ncbi:uncharacterized protein LOC112491337 [Ziziphus jujuba]|uniref:Uncharacterized protein LOC112491337 n=1 Tax=Ziziphus jujuba TaxID=326968 RepID=A0A6P6G4J7_ZIZJJ|nr:uncharacterized protein LOC112491337 [Ziziphus jujuba]